MKFKRVIESILISAVALGSVGVVNKSASASRIHPRRVRVSRTYHVPSKVHRFNRHAVRNHRHRIQVQRRIHRRNARFQRHQAMINAKSRKRHHHGRLTHRQSLNPKQRQKTNRFTTVHNRTRDLRNVKWESTGRGKYETVKSVSGPRVKFRTLRFIPTNVGHTHLVQSIAVTPNGRFAFLGCDAFPYLSGYTKIVRVNLRRKHGGLKIGPRFYGGHGQALAYNPKNHQLWLLVDKSGPLNHGSFDQISTRSLKPIHRVKFNQHGNKLGDTLTFDNQGNAYNENRIWQWDRSKRYKAGNIILYEGHLNNHRRHTILKRINQGIRKAPGYIIQGIAYNHRTGRLYIETDDAIMSIPVKKLGKLAPHDVHETILRGHREYEGISFNKRGHAYIVMARPNEILKSTRTF